MPGPITKRRKVSKAKCALEGKVVRKRHTRTSVKGKTFTVKKACAKKSTGRKHGKVDAALNDLRKRARNKGYTTKGLTKDELRNLVYNKGRHHRSSSPEY